MDKLTSEDIWYIFLGIGALLTICPGVFILSSTYFTKNVDIKPKAQGRKYLLSFPLLFLAFSFSCSGVYMALAEVPNPIKGIPIIAPLSLVVSLFISISMFSVKQVTTFLKNPTKKYSSSK